MPKLHPLIRLSRKHSKEYLFSHATSDMQVRSDSYSPQFAPFAEISFLDL